MAVVYQLIKKGVGVVSESEDKATLVSEANMVFKAEPDAVFTIVEKTEETSDPSGE